MTRDILVVNIDPSRVSDPELAAEAERDRLKALAAKFSAEDLMRAFDVLTKAEYEIRGSAYPRYHLEMALLRWIHLRKLVPISELIQGAERGSPAAVPRPAHRPAPPPGRPPSATAATVRAIEAKKETTPANRVDTTEDPRVEAPHVQQVPEADLKDAFLTEVRKSKKFFYGTVVAQAQRIDIDGDKVVFTFAPQHRPLRAQFDQTRPWLESLATQLSGRKMSVVSVEGVAASPAAKPGTPAGPPADPAAKDRQSDLRQQALADSGVQAMLDVFAAEIKDIEEM